MATRRAAKQKKSVKKSVAVKPFHFQKGADARRGRGPKKGAPNAGRPPSEIRKVLRASFEDRIPILERIADGTLKGDKLKAIEMMAKYGLGTTITPTDGDGKSLPAGITVTLVDPSSANG